MTLYLSPKGVAHLNHCHVNTVLAAIREGHLPVIRIYDDPDRKTTPQLAIDENDAKAWVPLTFPHPPPTRAHKKP